jgi:hypothetical protein
MERQDQALERLWVFGRDIVSEQGQKKVGGP